MKAIKTKRTPVVSFTGVANHMSEVPSDYTGVVELGQTTKVWLKDGKYHRTDGPAIEHLDTGSKFWYQNGLLHRDDNEPAVVYANGIKHWYKNGQRIER